MQKYLIVTNVTTTAIPMKITTSPIATEASIFCDKTKETNKMTKTVTKPIQALPEGLNGLSTVPGRPTLNFLSNDSTHVENLAEAVVMVSTHLKTKVYFKN